MSKSTLEKLKDVIQDTKEYARFVECENWDELNRLVNQRQIDLETIFSSAIPGEEKESAKELILEISNLDQELKKIIIEKQSYSLNEHSNLKSSLKAAKNYRTINDIS